jgi:hypothetical protein
MPVGGNAFDCARLPSNTLSSVMVWGAICEGYGPGYVFIWEKEILPGNKELNHLRAKENKEVVDAQRTRAHQPGTSEHRVLEEMNSNVRRLDEINPLPLGFHHTLGYLNWSSSTVKTLETPRRAELTSHATGRQCLNNTSAHTQRRLPTIDDIRFVIT